MSSPATARSAAMHDRQKAFKNQGKDSEELRRRRKDVSVELRKAKKDDMLSKRRNIDVDDEVDDLSTLGIAPPSAADVPTFDTLEAMRDAIVRPTDMAQLLGAVQAVRKILSRESNPPIDAVIETGIGPKLVALLSDVAFGDDMKFEAAWALTNIASGSTEQTAYVVNLGAVPAFVSLMSSSSPNVCEQAVWALGNISGDGSLFRDKVIEAGMIQPLIELINRPDITVTFRRNLAWAVSNLCRNKNPSPPESAVKQLLPQIKKLIEMPDNEIQADMCWALSYVTDAANTTIELVVKEPGLVISLLRRLATAPTLAILTPALRAVGNIITGTDAQTETMLSGGVLNTLKALLSHDKATIVKEAVWTVSNITAGNVHQIQQVLNSGVMRGIAEVLRSGDHRAQREAVWVVTNLTSGGNPQQISAMCASDGGLFKAFVDLISVNKVNKLADEKTVCVVLDGINNILKAALTLDRLDDVVGLLEEMGAIDSIEELQAHSNEIIYKKALMLIETFFGGDEDGDGEAGQVGVKQLGLDANKENVGGQFNF